MSVDLPLPPVPADIAIVREFVNTTDYETQSDDLTTPAELTAYLYAAQADAQAQPRHRGGSRAGAASFAAACGERSSSITTVRVAADPGARAGVGAAADRDGLVGQAVPGSSQGDGVRRGLAEIAVAMQRAVAEGIWWRLKICSSDECEWAYYDKSKNRSRSWCEYGCGNKLKMRAYRARQKAAE